MNAIQRAGEISSEVLVLPQQRKPIASLSLDLDNKWSYMKTRGEPGWESFPSYLDVFVPRVLSFLKARTLTITFFVVGQDASLEINREPLAAIAAAGHEIANHSFHHEPWLQLYPEELLETDLARAEENIERVTGQKPIGFRGPGFSLSRQTLRSLARRRYVYDATTFPTYLGPLARLYFFRTTQLSLQQKQQRKTLFGGGCGEGLRPISPYRWSLDTGELLEIPVTTMPILRLPIHASYIIYMSMFAPRLALSYFRSALRVCRLSGIQPSILLHPLDLLGSDDTQDLSFFPGMKLRSDKKVQLVSEVLRLLSNEFTVVTLRQHAREVAAIPGLPVVEPSFCQSQ
jgi:peptidoglycan/xylan/chitin deacetylase (PgdA/CDA1 family)